MPAAYPHTEPPFFRPNELRDGGSSPRKGPRSGLGKQAESKHTSAPRFSFGSGSREQAKLFLSAGHVDSVNRCTTSPGAIYQLPGCFSKQVENLKSTGRSFTLGTAEERKGLARENGVPGPGTYDAGAGAVGPQSQSTKVNGPACRISPSKDQRQNMYVSSAHVERERKGTQGVDPGTYHAPSSVGLQPLSSRRSGPSFTWGSEERGKGVFEKKAATTLPPVGAYDVERSTAAIGKQPLSNHATLPSYGFGSGTSWDQEHKRYLTLGHTHLQKGVESPANYDHQTEKSVTSFGKQVLSNKAHAPAASFGGTSQRNVFKTKSSPGPGAYD